MISRISQDGYSKTDNIMRDLSIDLEVHCRPIWVIHWVFTASGLLAIRAYLSGLGVPPVADLSVDGYLQQGGRFFFTLAAHLLIVGPAMYIIYALLGCVVNLFSRPGREVRWAVWTIVGLLILSVMGIGLLLFLLGRNPIFIPGHSSGVSEQAGGLGFLLTAEAIVISSIVWLYSVWPKLRFALQGIWWAQPLSILIMVMVGAQAVLVPTAFGRIAMLPKTLPYVTISNNKGEEQAKGLLVFSDKDNHFVWNNTSNRYVQVAKNNEQIVTYSSQRRIVTKETCDGS